MGRDQKERHYSVKKPKLGDIVEIARWVPMGYGGKCGEVVGIGWVGESAYYEVNVVVSEKGTKLFKFIESALKVLLVC